MAFRVVNISEPPLSDEQMGTKPKFWFTGDNGRLYLFKFARVNNGVVTGEDWAEKLAAELARLIGVESAAVDLATCQERRGVTVASFGQWMEVDSHGNPSFLPQRISLVHGNELLLERFGDYPLNATYRVSAHTVQRVTEVLDQFGVVGERVEAGGRQISLAASDTFVGYLMLDAWIGNTDRHHENWAVLDMAGGESQRRLLVLAPSYDHASSTRPQHVGRGIRRKGGNTRPQPNRGSVRVSREVSVLCDAARQTTTLAD